MKSVDLSGLDTLNVDEVAYMFYGCDSLTTIKTPKKTNANEVELPSGTWTGSDGNTYEFLPQNATESITLTKETE